MRGVHVRRPIVLEASAVVVVALLAVLAFAGQWQRPQARTGTFDSFWYLRSAAEYAGSDARLAADQAAQVYCTQIERAHLLGAQAAGCLNSVGIGEHVSARYMSIFTSRPGFPMAAAPLVAVLGLAGAMMIVTAGFFVLAALAAFAALRRSGVSRIGSIVGATAVCVLPLAFWDSRMMAEGAAQAGLVLAVMAAVVLLRRPSRPAMITLALALGWMFVTKPAQGAALCVTLLVAAAGVGLVMLRRAAPRTGGWPRVAAVTGVVGAAWWALSWTFHLPGLTETVQDMATRHFQTPDITDPLGYLVRRSAALWWHLPRDLTLLWPWVLVLAACAFVVWWSHGPGLVWSAAALSGAVVVSAHPLTSEYPRLIATIWLVVAAAAAMAYDAAVIARQQGGVRPRPTRVAVGADQGHGSRWPR